MDDHDCPFVAFWFLRNLLDTNFLPMEWRIPIPDGVDWRTINLDVLKEIQRMGEQRAQDSFDTIAAIRQRSFVIISILIPILSIMITAAAANPEPAYSLMAAAATLVAVFCIWQLGQLLMPKNTAVAGRPPSEVAAAAYLYPEDIDKQAQYAEFLMSEIRGIEFKIQFNEQVITAHLATFQRVVHLILVSAVLGAALVAGFSVWG